MLTVILAAGKSQRFRDAGCVTPKPLLPMPDGKPLINNQLDILKPETVRFVGSNDDKAFLINQIYRIVFNYPGMAEFYHHWIKPCPSPLASMWEVRRFIDVDEPLLVTYCDILFYEHIQMIDFAMENELCSVCVAFESSDERFQRTPDGKYALSGIFYFARGRDLAHGMRNMKRNTPDKGIHDVMVKLGNQGYFVLHEDYNLVDLGTPQAYKNYCAELGFPIQGW
jgi:GTP:adenosylcobinamide-phosphate guanylyltransferase